MSMIEVFQTNISNDSEAMIVTSQLRYRHEFEQISFDLDDCDHVLRVESTFIDAAGVIKDLSALGFQCAVMPD